VDGAGAVGSRVRGARSRGEAPERHGAWRCGQ